MPEESNCVFCKIVSGKLPSARVWEDNEFMALLDINPNTKGATLVISKEHYDSYAFDMPDDAYGKLMLASKKVARMLEKGLGVHRVAMVMEGLGVNHVHIKLYPLHGLQGKFAQNLAKEIKFFDKYEGYVSTLMGPKKELAELEALAGEIREKSGRGS